MRRTVQEIRLTDFRSYARADLAVGGASVFLFGPNGAGKTNLLEALSLLSPGRGLRGAPLAEMGRRASGEAPGRTWSVFAVIDGDGEGGPARVGTGLESPGAARRTARLDGETIPTTRLADIVCPIWLTPAQDRLFLEGSAERRRFFDRLVFAGRPEHAAVLAAYERALRERTRLLAEPSADPAWIAVLEREMAQRGALVAQARAATLAELGAEIEARADGAFPRAGLALTGHWEQMAASGAGAEAQQARETAAIEAALAEALAAGRPRDAAGGRALAGPHRGDLIVTHLGRGRPAGECSTGEQKALILNLVLAQAGRLSRAKSRPNPILLLDEVAAHLDPARRGALFDEIEALGLQAFLTGTEAGLFATLEGRALGVHVDDSRLNVLDRKP